MSWLNPERVLVPIDFSHASLQAVTDAARAMPDVADLHVVHVVPGGGGSGARPGRRGPPPAPEGAELGLIEADAREALAEAGLGHLELHIVTGDPAQRIVSLAQSLDAQLIVIPAQGGSTLPPWLLGSVADRVTRTAHCPVLLLRHHSA